MDERLVVTAAGRIPRRIIQTGKTRHLRPLAKAAATNLRLLHPDWEYCYFDDSDVEAFIRAEFPQHTATFETFAKTIQRIDFFRYLAIYRLGGFYFDLDVFLSEPLDDLLDRGAVFPFEEITMNRYLRQDAGIDWEMGNYGFGATPGHPYLRAVIENCVRAQRDRPWARQMLQGIPSIFRAEFEILTTTGPGLLTRTLVERPEAGADVSVLFPHDVCDDTSWHQFGRYGVHLMEGSWREGGGRLWRRLAWMWEGRERRRCMVESRRLGPLRQAARDAATAHVGPQNKGTRSAKGLRPETCVNVEPSEESRPGG